MKKIVYIVLFLINIGIFATSSELAVLSSTLESLALKTTSQKISEKNYTAFYAQLRKAIGNSLIAKKIDLSQFNILEENYATQAAQAVLTKIFTSSQPYVLIGSFQPYLHDVTSPPRTIFQNFTFEWSPHFLNEPLENIIDQILLISRVVAYIISHHQSHENISILSIQGFMKIFNSFFAEVLINIRTNLEKTDRPIGKVNITFLNNFLDQKTYQDIKNKLEESGGGVNNYKTANEIKKSNQKFDIYIINKDYKLLNEKDNEKIIIKDNKKMILACDYDICFSAVEKGFPVTVREAVFNDYIDEEFLLGDLSKTNRGYSSNPSKNLFIYFSQLIDKTRRANDKIVPLFIQDHQTHWLTELLLPNIDWAYIAYETIGLFYHSNTNWEYYTLNFPNFIKIDESYQKKIKVRQIASS